MSTTNQTIKTQLSNINIEQFGDDINLFQSIVINNIDLQNFINLISKFEIVDIDTNKLQIDFDNNKQFLSNQYKQNKYIILINFDELNYIQIKILQNNIDNSTIEIFFAIFKIDFDDLFELIQTNLFQSIFVANQYLLLLLLKQTI